MAWSYGPSTLIHSHPKLLGGENVNVFGKRLLFCVPDTDKNTFFNVSFYCLLVNVLSYRIISFVRTQKKRLVGHFKMLQGFRPFDHNM